MRARIGQTLTSTVDATTVVVVRWPDADLDLTCGGAGMVDAAESPGITGAVADGQSDGTLLGKRYADEGLGVEVLCTKAGTGTLALNGTALAVKAAKPLPASD